MWRRAVPVISGLCATPALALFALAVADLVLGSGGGSDQAIAKSYLALLGALFAAVAGGTGVAIAASRLPARWRPHLLAIDGVVIVGLIVAWAVFMADPAALEYADARPLLEAELRIPKTAGGRDLVQAFVFTEGLLDTLHDDRIRDDGAFVILPWETTPYRVRSWVIEVLLHGVDSSAMFSLDLPTRPVASTEWSNWLPTDSSDDATVPPGLALRFRFRLIPYGQE